MRGLAVGLSLLSVGCIDAPLPEELLFDEAHEFEQPYAHIPDGVRPAPPIAQPESESESHVEPSSASQPRVIVSRYDTTRIEDEEYGLADGTALCPFDVKGIGFPAIDASSSTVATFTAEVLSSSDGEDEIVTFGRQDATGNAVLEGTVILDGDEATGQGRCWKLYKRARARAKVINATLLHDGYRAMEALPLALKSEWAEDPFSNLDDTDSLSPHERPVEVATIHDDAVLRIPGVKVFARTSTAQWGEADDFDPESGGCWFEDPYVSAAFADRTSGVILLRVAQMGGPCFCYAATQHHSWVLDPETVAQIYARNGPLSEGS